MAKKRATPKTSSAKREPNKGGRPPTYNPKFHPQAAKVLCAKGATIAELAAAFDVAISTIWQWKITHPEFFESCKVGFEVATERVEHSMFERAVGYTHESTKIFLPAGASKPVYAPYLEHVPPDPRAGEFWLTNRAPDRWKNKQNVEHNEAEDSPIRQFAKQLMGTAIRPRLPEPKIIEHAPAEPSVIRPQPQNVTNVTTAEPVTRAPVVTRPVDDDDEYDQPRTPRIHTISQTYEDDDDDE